MDGKLNSKVLSETIMKLPEGVTELMVHPAYGNNAPLTGVIETKALCHSSIKDVINDNEIFLTSFRGAFNIQKS